MGLYSYTATKEICHIITYDGSEEDSAKGKQSFSTTLALIVVMNLVFSVDSILTAISLTDVLWVMVVAIMIGGLIMIILADQVSEFLKKNRVYEVLAYSSFSSLALCFSVKALTLATCIWQETPSTPCQSQPFILLSLF